MPLGWPADPDDLFVNDDGSPVRIDKAFSWEYPLSVHGLMHNVITNAWRGDPYKIDTLMVFMANMAWNSSMNTSEVRKMLNDKDEEGEYKIPFIIVADAFQSEMVAYADLVLPDTTYLERHDVMSMLDRPISEYEGPVDSVRIPVLPPKGECKPFQEVVIELGTRLKLPAFVNADGSSRKYRDYPDFVINYETSPGSGIGFLAGWRGKGGEKFMKGEPNPKQWEMYEKNNCVFQLRIAKVLPIHAQLEPGVPGMGQTACAVTLYRANQYPYLLRSSCRNSGWPHRVNLIPNNHRTICANVSKHTFDPHCRSIRSHWKLSSRICINSHSMPSHNARWRCITHGIRRMPG